MKIMLKALMKREIVVSTEGSITTIEKAEEMTRSILEYIAVSLVVFT